MDLFGKNLNGAIFSNCKKHRYVLWRIWDESKPKIMFIGLNPSTANESNDDPTIRRIKKFAFDWGFGGVYMLNLYSFVTPYPNELEINYNEVLNETWINDISKKCEKIIFAWGNFKEAEFTGKNIARRYKKKGYVLGINKNGSPKHPLYVKSNVKIKLYEQ